MLTQGLSNSDQETFKDASYAVEMLQVINSQVPEDEVEDSSIEVNAGKLRDCLELMLSLLEVHEGFNVNALEDMYQVMQCLKVHHVAEHAREGNILH